MRLTKPADGEVHAPESWSPDGRHLLFGSTKDLKTTLMVLTTADGRVEPFGGVTSMNPTTAAFSPDGRWVAYAANTASSESFVYVQPFPATGEIYQVSKEGENGHHPMWTRDGKELLYVPQVGRAQIDPRQTRQSTEQGWEKPVNRTAPDGRTDAFRRQVG